MDFLLFQSEAHRFLEKLENELEAHPIVLEKHWMVDHLCYRTTDLREYEFYKAEFLNFSVLLAETEVRGRPIATFKLKEGIFWRGQKIDIVELPAPKPGKIVKSGFEHIEIVCDCSFQDLMSQFTKQKWDTKGLNKLINPELEFELSGCAIKFHHLSLESVVKFEQHPRVQNNKSLLFLLEILNEHHPLLVGTLPLGLDTVDSDLDIMISINNKIDFENLQKKLMKNWNLEASEDFIVLHCEDLKIEILCQNKPSTEQVAFRHFLIEERLLRLGGDKLKKNLQNWRFKGFKTEPAFAKALNIEGDPYQGLLTLQRMSDQEILKQFEESVS